MGRLLQSKLPSFFSTSTYVLACQVQRDHGSTSRSLAFRHWWSIDERVHSQTQGSTSNSVPRRTQGNHWVWMQWSKITCKTSRRTFRRCIQGSREKSSRWFQQSDKGPWDHGVLPSVVVLQCLTSRYLGCGMLDPTYIDEEYPCRSSPQCSMMFWDLGNWCRKSFDKCPVPERLQRFTPHKDYNPDVDHNPIGDDKPQFNNYFFNVTKNFGGHLFMNCEAGTLYPHGARPEPLASTIIMIWWLLLVSERKDIWGKLLDITPMRTTRASGMSLGKSSKSSGERPSTETHKRLKIWQEQGWRWHACVFIMLDRSMLQIHLVSLVNVWPWWLSSVPVKVGVIAGDGNKACYFATKSPGVPIYQHSLWQYWINKMMNVATQAWGKNHDQFCPPVRVKHFISCSYRDLVF